MQPAVQTPGARQLRDEPRPARLMRGSHATTVVSMEVPPMGATGPSAAGQHSWHWLAVFGALVEKKVLVEVLLLHLRMQPHAWPMAVLQGGPAGGSEASSDKAMLSRPWLHDKFLSFQEDLDEPLGQLVSNLQDAHLETTAACGFLSAGQEDFCLVARASGALDKILVPVVLVEPSGPGQAFKPLRARLARSRCLSLLGPGLLQGLDEEVVDRKPERKE